MSVETTSLPGTLCRNTLEEVVAGAKLQEIKGKEGSFMTLRSAIGPDPVGEVRIFTGTGPVAKAVYVSLAVPQIGLDSHMTFAFAAADSAIPHFTLDSVHGQGSYAFHLDLIPRVDLASHIEYMDWAYSPLTPKFEEVRAWEGLTATSLSPRQIAMMSTWMLVSRATEGAFRQMTGPVAAYRDHWLGLVDDGVPEGVAESIVDVDIAARDQRHRAALFSPDVDPVWHQVSRLVGDEVMERIRTQLLTNEV